MIIGGLDAAAEWLASVRERKRSATMVGSGIGARFGSGMNGISRRELLKRASAAAVVGGMAKLGFAQSASGSSTAAAAGKGFPEKFLWGCATAAHQVEGNNTN